MLSTLLVIGGVVAGLVLLLALIVSLSARSTSRPRGGTSGARTRAWVADAGREHPDAWAPLSHTSTEIRAVR